MDRHDLGLIQELAEDLRRTSVSLRLSSRCPTATMGSHRQANDMACLRIECRMTATDRHHQLSEERHLRIKCKMAATGLLQIRCRTAVMDNNRIRCKMVDIRNNHLRSGVAHLPDRDRMTATDVLRLLLRVVRPLARNFVSYAVELEILTILTLL
jgi:hypothetical protein